VNQYYFEPLVGASAIFEVLAGVNTGALSVNATHICPGAKRISSPVGKVQEVPDSAVGRFHSAWIASPSRKINPFPLPTVAENGVTPPTLSKYSEGVIETNWITKVVGPK
jgi:hypothetical protein